jgi:cysteinyl-tRNA synthetase
MHKLAPILVVSILLVVSSGCLQFTDEGMDAEDEMRSLVVKVSDYARQTNPNFVVIVENGEDLASDGGRPANNYLATVDGVAREDLFFGWNGLDTPTPWSISEEMSARLNESKDAGQTVMVVDRCSERGYLWDAMEWADERDFLYFGSDSEGLDTIPAYPADPPGTHRGDVTDLSEAHNLLVLTVAQGWDSREDYLDALQRTNFDVLVIDGFFNKTPLTEEEVDSLRVKKHGGNRLVIAVMGLGELDERQHIWRDLYHDQPPPWLGDAVTGKTDLHRVKYWSKGWRSVLYKSEESWLDSILDSGFDGVYLTGGDAHKDF